MAKLFEVEVKDPIYQNNISYLVGGDEKAVYRFIEKRHGKRAKLRNKDTNVAKNKYDPKEPAGGGLQFHVLECEDRFYCWIAECTIDLLFHETQHLIFDVLAMAGVEYSDGAEEAFAYWGANVF